MWSPNELLKIEKQRDILSYITLQFFHFKKVPLEHCPFAAHPFFIPEQPMGIRHSPLSCKLFRCRSHGTRKFYAFG